MGARAPAHFGVGADLDEAAWRGVIRQMVALGLLHADPERHGGLCPTDAAKPVLRSEQPLQLRRARPAPLRRRDKAKKVPAAATGGSGEQALFDALRDLRRRVAEAEKVPAYVVFHDATLHELARLRPASEAELAGVSGIGTRKLERYGAELLPVLRDFSGTP